MKSRLFSLIVVFVILFLSVHSANADVILSQTHNIPDDKTLGNYVTFTFTPQSSTEIHMTLAFFDENGNPATVQRTDNEIDEGSHSKIIEGLPVNSTFGFPVNFNIDYNAENTTLCFAVEGQFGFFSFDESVSCEHYDYWEFLGGSLDYFSITVESGVSIQDMGINGTDIITDTSSNSISSGDGVTTYYSTDFEGIESGSSISLEGQIALGYNFLNSQWTSFSFTLGTYATTPSSPPSILTPEPTSMLIFAVGLGGLGYATRRYRKN